MLQVDPTKRPEISEVVADLESIALSRYVELKGSIVSWPLRIPPPPPPLRNIFSLRRINCLLNKNNALT